jgi:hypothetical protein
MTIALGRQGSRSRSGVESFTHRIAITDTLVIIWSLIGAQIVRFGTDGMPDGTDGPQTSTVGVNYQIVSVILIFVWLGALKVYNAYDPRLFGHGPEEYRAVAGATFRLFAA